ncbi:MAG: hypothetical protein LBD33_00955 [Puniceicoccales bacterium]|jgi:hypothetical protein|nr:hypothetical protein [Puniceicoccales bacterium]
MDGIDSARQSETIAGREAGFLKKYINAHTRNLAGATLLAFNKLRGEWQRDIMESRKLRERSAEVSSQDEIAGEGSELNFSEKLDGTIEDMLSENKSAGRIDGHGAGLVKRLLSGGIRNLNGVPLRSFNALSRESKVACFKSCPEFKERALQTTGLNENSEDDEIIEALEAREHFESWAQSRVKGLRKQSQICNAFGKLDNETQAILAADGNPSGKFSAIDAKVESGAIGESVGELLRKLVKIDQVCKDQETGHITRQEAGYAKRYAQGFTKTIKDGSATAMALSKMSEDTRDLLMPNRRLKSRSAKASAARVTVEEMIANTMKTGAKAMRKNIEFNLFLSGLKKISDGEPIEITVEDEHGKRPMRIR